MAKCPIVVNLEVDEAKPIKEEALTEYLNNLKYIEPCEDKPLYDVFELQNDVFVGERLIKKGYRTIRLTSLENLKKHMGNGLDINLKDPKGNTELHRACEDKLVNKVKLLCEAGADVNILNNKGQTPIDIVSDLREFPVPCKIGRILKSYGAVE